MSNFNLDTGRYCKYCLCTSNLHATVWHQIIQINSLSGPHGKAMYLGKRIRIAIVDNDKLAISMMRLLIVHLLPSADICWTAFTGEEAVSKSLFDKTQPDVLIVDMSLEGMSGFEVCRRIRSRTPKIALIGVTAFSPERYYADALSNGANCLIPKVQMRDICRASYRLANGQQPGTQYESSETAQEAYSKLSPEDAGQYHKNLTRRETEVMSLCARGYTSQEIGDYLGIGESTVKTYIKRVTEKMDVKNRTQAVICWLKERES